MNAWTSYSARLNNAISAKSLQRDRVLERTQISITKKLPASLSYKAVTINNTPQNIAVLNQEELNIKTICAMPGETLIHGGIVDWANNKWLITEIDAHNEVYEKGVMQQCNHLLRWRDSNGDIIEKWCIVEDGTKYLIGEKQEDIMTKGDARIAVTISKDADTIKIGRGRRFLIDDTDSDEILAYQITKSNRLYNVYNNEGIFRYILNEVNTTDNDNFELRVADYYQPTMNTDTDSFDDVVDTNDEKDVWI